MEQTNSPDRNAREAVLRRYIRASDFAWLLMVVLTFAASLGVQLALHDHWIALTLAAISLIGLLSRELCLMWLFKGTPPPLNEKAPKSRWLGNMIHAVAVMVVWLVVEASEGPLTLRSFVFAFTSGLALAAYLWWQQSRSPMKGRPVR